jgi:hypothetical protein
LNAKDAKAAKIRQAYELGVSLWTLNRSDFIDVPGLTLFAE